MVTSLRFPNELEALRKRAALIAHVTRHGHGPVNSHVSERWIISSRQRVGILNTADTPAY